ncbi:MAG TPA: hypothetical protein VMW02_02895 [Thermoplasmata archaeon]|nr:hypothetical protein [Thermoplasmata archaeon]
MRIKRELTAVIAILAVFSIGTLGYVAFSADKPDGLEKTMEDAGVVEQAPIYVAPFSYGEGYFGYLAGGIIGFFAVLLVSIGILKRLAKKNEA